MFFRVSFILAFTLLSTACGPSTDVIQGIQVAPEAVAQAKTAIEHAMGVVLPPHTFSFVEGNGANHDIVDPDGVRVLGYSQAWQELVVVAMVTDVTCKDRPEYEALGQTQALGTALYHELMHAALLEKYGDADANHTREGAWYQSDDAVVLSLLIAAGYAEVGGGCK